MDDVLIVGSGVSGVAAALRLAERKIRPRIVDVGLKAEEAPAVGENFYLHRLRHDTYEMMIGKGGLGLADLIEDPPRFPAKLASPRMRFVTERAGAFSPVEPSGFSLVQSFARGGLANAWGAGLYRYTDRDLKDYPLRAADLAPYYDLLTREIGISGAEDDLAPYFGSGDDLLPPLRLSLNASEIFGRYVRKRKLFQDQGIFIGRPRLGVLSEDYRGRKACKYSNMEFWQPGIPWIYNPVFTLDRLVREGRVSYTGNHLVRSWSRKEGRLEVEAENVETGERVVFSCRKLVLAAGAVGSARLVLQTKKDFRTRLALLDNPALQFPFVIPGRVGCGLETDAFGLTQLNMIYDLPGEDQPLQGSLLELTSPARAEFFSRFPWAARDNLRLIRYVLPAMVVLQVFFPTDRKRAASLRLREDGTLEVKGTGRPVDAGWKKEIVRIFRHLGAYSSPSLVVDVPEGHSIHYAGTLPMKENPDGPYACTRNGELHDEPDVYVADGAACPSLAAKNVSFTLMANAMRIADHVAAGLEK